MSSIEQGEISRTVEEYEGVIENYNNKLSGSQGILDNFYKNADLDEVGEALESDLDVSAETAVLDILDRMAPEEDSSAATYLSAGDDFAKVGTFTSDSLEDHVERFYESSWDNDYSLGDVLGILFHVTPDPYLDREKGRGDSYRYDRGVSGTELEKIGSALNEV